MTAISLSITANGLWKGFYQPHTWRLGGSLSLQALITPFLKSLSSQRYLNFSSCICIFFFFFFFQGHNLKFLSECDDALVYTVEEIITAHSYLNYNGNLKTSI